MVTIQSNPALTPHELEVMDDVMDIVREERRSRFSLSTSLVEEPFGHYRQAIGALRYIASQPKKRLLKIIYLELADIAEDIIDEVEYQHARSERIQDIKTQTPWI